MAASDSPDPLLARPRDAMGGASRIGAVSTYARESVIRSEPTGASRERSSVPRTAERWAGSRSLVASLVHCLGAGGGREMLVRSAPGRAWLEVWSRDADGRGSCVLSATAGPDSRHDHGPAGGRTAAPSTCAGCAGDVVLREAAREPRNLLAHAEERGALARQGADGGLEVVIMDEGLLYRFDANTGLCATRTAADGSTVLYADWRPVDGVQTPFLEVEEGDFGRLERRVIAVAYDLPWPAGLFRPQLL